jgi:hypothetical protein
MMTGVLNRKRSAPAGTHAYILFISWLYTHYSGSALRPQAYILFNHGCTHYSGSALRRRRRAGTRGAGQSALSTLE